VYEAPKKGVALEIKATPKAVRSISNKNSDKKEPPHQPELLVSED
jgi:hypothetical protein